MSRDEPVPDYLQALKPRRKKLRVGVPRRLFAEQLDADHATAFAESLRVLATEGAIAQDVVLPPVRRSIGFDTMAEFYGEHEPHITKTPETYQPQTRQQLETAGKVTAAAYSRSQYEMAVARRKISTVFSEVDLLALPTILQPPLRLEEVGKIRRPSHLALVMPFNLYDLPALTLPCGFTRSGLPIGLQIVGPRFGEFNILALGHAYERATEWHKRRPNL
jgi:aspartyl-tRNA(Asn)/glutamyl-tRNA(Gln) amidotransferase subunit A